MIITRNNRKFDINVERVDRWNCKITVCEIIENGKYHFIGKVISNNVDYAIAEIIEEGGEYGE